MKIVSRSRIGKKVSAMNEYSNEYNKEKRFVFTDRTKKVFADLGICYMFLCMLTFLDMFFHAVAGDGSYVIRVNVLGEMWYEVVFILAGLPFAFYVLFYYGVFVRDRKTVKSIFLEGAKHEQE